MAEEGCLLGKLRSWISLRWPGMTTTIIVIALLQSMQAGNACPLPGPHQYLQCLRIADRSSQQADMNALHGTYTAGRGTCIHKGLEIVHRCLAACAVSALLAMMTSAELPAALDHLDCRAGHTCPSLWYWLMQLQQGSCTSPGSLSMPLSAAIALQQAER